ncbi:MAG TPA: DPP IV N-terminal domain-containing protein, partial [Longimicrobiales bacterium]|nr:DPP IV N-terminal domain-containing protein [Longimicrobiales bacterium]
TKLAFESDRAGSVDLYVLDLESGGLVRVTYSDAAESLDAWSPDGKWLYFATTVGDVGGLTDEYRVSSSGGEPVPVAAARYQPEYFASPSPDGKSILVDGRARMGYSQWWRNGHAHIDEAEIWRVTLGGTPSYTRLTEPGTKNLWPMWTPDGRSVLFMSDRSGSENLWTMPVAGGTPRQLTHFTKGRLLWPTLSSDGKTVVFERDFGVWSMAVPDGTPHELAVHLRGASPGPTVTHERMTSGFSDLALSPDGRKVAFIARGEVFAAPADSGGPAERVTSTTAPEAEIAWAPDSRRIAYLSRRSGTFKIRVYDFGTRTEKALTTGAGSDATPQWSPDGSRIAFVRDAKQLMVADVESGKTTTLATADLWREPLTPNRPLQWSPDGKWLAYLATDQRMFENVHVVRADGSEPAQAVSRLADTNAGAVEWAPDGKAVFYATGQRTKDGQIAQVDLVKRTPAFRETKFWDLFRKPPSSSSNSNSNSKIGSSGRPASEPGPRSERGSTSGSRATSTSISLSHSGPRTRADSVNVSIDFRGIFDRLELLPLQMNAGSFAISPDGKTLVFQAQAEGQSNLYEWNLDPLAESHVARQLTSTPGYKGMPIFSPDGKEVYFLDRGRISKVSLKGNGRPSTVGVTAEMDVNFAKEKEEVFDEGWTYLRDEYFNPTMNGVDWPAVKKEFAPYIAGAQTRQELGRLMNLMVGELNGSHLGAGQPRGGERAEVGRLGLRFDPASLADGRFVISDVVPLGPADVAGITAGSSITSIDGTPTQGRNLNELLANKVGDLVRVAVADASGRNEHVVEVKPISTGAENQLEYRAWVQRN